MDRLQKRCFVASAITHGALVLTVVFGSAFIGSQPAVEVTPVTVYSGKLVDIILNGGGGGSPAPRVQPQPVQPVAPPPAPRVPQPVIQPQPQPRPVAPPPEPTRHVKEPEITAPPKENGIYKASTKPPQDTTSGPKLPKVSLKPVIRTDTERQKAYEKAKQHAAEQAAAEEKAAAAAAQAARDARAAKAGAIADAVANGLPSNGGLSAKELTGFGSGAGAVNYLQAVLGAYDAAWVPPTDADNESTVVVARVVVSHTGRIISATIRKRSNIPALDRSVQRALDAVGSLPPFPEGAKDLERTININFDLRAKRAAA